MSNNAFPFNTLREGWAYFDKLAQTCFSSIIEQESKKNPNIIKKAKLLKNKDYCARLIFILNIFAYKGNQDSEFDMF